MYRTIAACVLSLLCISAAGVDSRVERWNLRVEKLKKIQADADKCGADSSLIHELAAYGIKSSEEFLELLARYKKEDGSLKSDMKKYTVSEIENMVDKVSRPAITLYFLSEILKASYDGMIKQKISGEINAFITKKYGNGIKLSAAESGEIAVEYIFEKSITDFSSVYSSLKTDILSRTEYELSRRDYNTNDSDIVKLILRHTEDSAAAGKLSENIPFEEKYLAAIPQWRFFEDRLLKNEERKKSVINFIHAKRGVQGTTISEPDILNAEREIFENKKNSISAMLQNTTSTGGITGSNPLYEIPDIRKLAAIVLYMIISGNTHSY